MAGTRLGVAWGIASLAAGLRWGALGLGDVAVATRLNGATLASGPLVVRIGMAAAAAGALLGEAQVDGLRSRTWGERAASVAALLAVIALFVVPGPGDPGTLRPVAWGAAGVAAALLVLLLSRAAGGVPFWAPVLLASFGVATAVVG
jgi:hypothetical protein